MRDQDAGFRATVDGRLVTAACLSELVVKLRILGVDANATASDTTSALRSWRRRFRYPTLETPNA
jgi:hypothetical protein